MHFIKNNIGNIIAADNAFLTSLNLNSLDELKTQIILNELQIINYENKIDIATKSKSNSYVTKNTSFYSDFGELILTQCLNELVEEIPKENIILKTIPDTPQIDLDIPKIDLPELNIAQNVHQETNSVIALNIQEISKEIGISVQDYKKFFNEYKETAISLKSKLQSQNDTERIETIHTVQELSNVLKLPLIDDMMNELKSIPAYNSDNHINKFYTTLSQFRIEENTQIQNILNTNEPIMQRREEATQVNSNNVYANMNNTEVASTIPHVESDIGNQLLEFNNFVDNTSKTNNEIMDIPSAKEDRGTILSHAINKMQALRLEEKNAIVETKESIAPSFNTVGKNTNNNKDLDLTNIFPVPFVYNMNEVSKELGLPIELMNEFVQDFIEQSRNSTPKLLQAYRDNDIQSIRNIGRFLKDGSENLRIIPLSNSLQNLQNIADTSHMNRLIKDYWSHFLSLEKQIKSFSR